MFVTVRGELPQYLCVIGLGNNCPSAPVDTVDNKPATTSSGSGGNSGSTGSSGNTSAGSSAGGGVNSTIGYNCPCGDCFCGCDITCGFGANPVEPIDYGSDY